MLGNAGDLILVILGFGFVILVHELGHFLAARWAGVRVHDFAIGFGNAIVSWRRGLGFRRGTSHPEYQRMLTQAQREQGTKGEAHPSLLPAVSPTEYRLNWLPFGGYVRMLGQEDLDPNARSNAPDSYNSKPVWKRMVIISAGVVMNVILAALLYIAVFMVGLEMESPRLGRIGGEAERSAEVVDAPEDVDGDAQRGLRSGDTITAINGNEVETFEDVRMRVAMSRGGRPVRVSVDRPGVGALTLAVDAGVGEATRLRELDALPAATAELVAAPATLSDEARADVRAYFDRMGLVGVEPGATLLRVQGRDGVDGLGLAQALQESGGAPVDAVFVNPDGERVEVSIAPGAELEKVKAPLGGGDAWELDHLLGLAGPLMVGEANSTGRSAGLRDGDLFVRVGWLEWPDIAQGVRTIRENRGGTVDLGLLRDGERLSVEAPVQASGQVGFNPGAMTLAPPYVTGALGERVRTEEPYDAGSAAALALAPGSRIAAVGGARVETWSDVREALTEATRSAHALGEGASVELVAIDPISGETSLDWPLTAGEVERLHGLGWEAPFEPYAIFEYERTMREASNPVEAIGMGVRETHRVMVTTYLTILRLTQGTVKVEHLKGPVGIAHLGTRVADRGLVWLVFFMAMVSVNLAVLNFLPLPIVDGGQFVFLAVEGLTGRPVSARVQGIAMILGLALIGSVFLVVTFNDVRALFGAM